MWEKKIIKPIDMLHFLGILYANTAVGYKILGLQTLIETNAAQPIVAKRTSITRALLNNKVVLSKGHGQGQAYKWNKEVGVPSIPMAEMLIEESASILRAEQRRTRRKRKLL